MEKTYKKFLLILLVIIGIIMSSSRVMAADYTCDLEVKSDKTQIKKGESITYEIRATNIQAETGIIMFNALVNYDSQNFDCKVLGIDGDWSLLSFMENYIQMTRLDYMPHSEDQSIARITLTAKTDAKEGKYDIALENIKFTMDNNKSFELSNRTLSVNIIGENENTEEKEDKQDAEEEQDTQAKQESDTSNADDNISENITEDEENVEDQDNENDIQDEENEIIENDKSNQDQDEEISKKSVSATETEKLSKKVLPYTGILKVLPGIVLFIAIIVAGIFYLRYKYWRGI